MFTLNKGQKECVSLGVEWSIDRYKPTFEFSGAPGTGKSTVAKYLAKAIHAKRPLYIAFTGNAVKELRKKGLPAKTLHSAIYNYERVFLKIDGNLVLRSGYPVTTVRKVLKTKIDGDPDYIFVDECGMVDRDLVKDLLTFGIPIIAMGDKDQLGPVAGLPGFFSNGPDYVLTEYMRQALYSGIIRASKYINEGGILRPGMDFGPDVEIISRSMLRPKTLTLAESNITPSNRMRRKLNSAYRDYMGYEKDYVIRGEKIICKKNAWDNVLDDNTPLVNGTVGRIHHYPNYAESKLKDNKLLLDFRPLESDDDYFGGLTIDYKHLITDGVETDEYNKSLLKFEFGYAISVYASQGAEYDSVLYVDDWIHSEEFMKKNRFTAVTRAKRVLGIAI